MYYESYGDDNDVTLDEEPTIHDPVVITESELGPWTEVGSQCRLNDSEVGAYSYLMRRVQLDHAGVGKFSSIASDVRLGPPNHTIERPTAHHVTYRAAQYGLGDDDERVFEWRAGQPVTVGHDVWIGHGATVLPGVTIGNGAVVGAGAVVTHDVDPYTVVGGTPATPIRRRFDTETAARIEATEWWDWSHETLRERLPTLRDTDTFLAEHAPERA
ncbi:DapH/DapD/GlmU-related protein [Halarchaeum nitratireducens]|uniref:Acetyltransferase n=1 Tax=Halarchaeum nitratireducens TaxID=489913 RepID=A0A830GEZ4_9EURY|nr:MULTISPECIES: DapH/DapD/GlmU-related protein [Halarchaeum]MBP2250994.1 phosphonate metabolism protein (transferase hexapeptide repeat family) [Halarchaeum solikamskense]GGN21536.1 acetyltransferase [Halarchaeum nitratireducens]